MKNNIKVVTDFQLVCLFIDIYALVLFNITGIF